MKKLWQKKEYIVIGLIVLLFLFISGLSLFGIQRLQGNARVVNYIGIVRGATQKLVKEELMGHPDDELIARLDTIINELITGEGTYGLVALDDKTYMDYMWSVHESWQEIKTEIQHVRAGADNTRLYDLSQDYFTLVDNTVSAAEHYSEGQVRSTSRVIWAVNAAFVLILIFALANIIRAAALKKKADALDKLAYIDQLTQVSNRASCERLIDELTAQPPAESVCVFMFDMNNLKTANENLGHQGGDRIIADFARILKTEAGDRGFVGRYGGDEFIALFVGFGESDAEAYMTGVNEKVIAYNLLHINEIERLSFAAGYHIGYIADMTVDEMINQADRKMYARKRQMKENNELLES